MDRLQPALVVGRWQRDDAGGQCGFAGVVVDPFAVDAAEGDGGVGAAQFVVGLAVAQTFDEGGCGDHATRFAEGFVGQRARGIQFVRAAVKGRVFVVGLEGGRIEHQPPGGVADQALFAGLADDTDDGTRRGVWGKAEMWVQCDAEMTQQRHDLGAIDDVEAAAHGILRDGWHSRVLLLLDNQQHQRYLWTLNRNSKRQRNAKQ